MKPPQKVTYGSAANDVCLK